MSSNQMGSEYQAYPVTRRTVRYVAALLAGLTATIYLLIGFCVVSVIEAACADQVFGTFAAVAYLLGMVLLLFLDNRWLWGLGAAFQVIVIFLYFNLAPQRVPAYEVWGILIRIAQLLLLGALVYLAIRPAPRGVRGTGGSR
ncbi:MAG: hypothetical protein N2318_09925 [Meiothermus sp.]|nr:hypothetical protein [Meiothermus sp.]